MQNSVPSNWPNSQYSEYVETRFHSWHIQRLGKSRGKKILFIHGTGSSCHTWSDIIECLQDEFDVLSKRVENLEAIIQKLKKQKKKVKRAKRS